MLFAGSRASDLMLPLRHAHTVRAATATAAWRSPPGHGLSLALVSRRRAAILGHQPCCLKAGLLSAWPLRVGSCEFATGFQAHSAVLEISQCGGNISGLHIEPTAGIDDQAGAKAEARRIAR